MHLPCFSHKIQEHCLANFYQPPLPGNVKWSFADGLDENVENI
jgi:hypothetical protein